MSNQKNRNIAEFVHDTEQILKTLEVNMKEFKENKDSHINDYTIKVKKCIEEHTRISYSGVIYYVQKIHDEAHNAITESERLDSFRERMDNILSNIAVVYTDFNEKEMRDDVYNATIRIYDYCKAAMDKISLDISIKEDITKGFVEIAKQEVKEEVRQKVEEEVTDLRNSIITQLVSILGIFTAIAFLVFGGLNQIDRTTIITNELPDVFAILMTWSLLVLGCIFVVLVLLWGVSKIADINLFTKSNKALIFLGTFCTLCVSILFNSIYYLDKTKNVKMKKVVITILLCWIIAEVLLLIGVFILKIIEWQKEKSNNESTNAKKDIRDSSETVKRYKN